MNPAQANALDDQSLRQKRKQLFIFFLIIFTLIICAIISVFTALKHQIESESLSANPEKAIQAACKVTEYQPICIKSISSLHNPSHKKLHASDVFRLSIDVAFQDFLKIHQLPQEIASKTPNKNIRSILTDCQNLFNDSLNQLNRSLIMITGNGLGLEEILGYQNEEMMKDLRNMMDQATKNIDRCVDGLDGKGTTQREIEVIKNAKKRIQEAEKYMANSLAMLENKDSIRETIDPSLFRSMFAFFILKEDYVVITVFCSQYLFLVFLVGSFLRVFR